MDQNFQSYQNDYQNNGNMIPQAPKTNSGLATASLVLGIIALVCTTVCCCCYYVSIVFAVISIILGFVSRSSTGGVLNGKARTGLILSFIAVFLFVVMIACEILFAEQIQAFTEEYLKTYEDMLKELTAESGELN